MAEEDILYSTRKFAELAGVSIRTLKRWLKNGILIPAVKCDNGYNFYSQEQLDNLKRVTPFDEDVTPFDEDVTPFDEDVTPLTKSESKTCDTQVENFEKPVTQETKGVTRSDIVAENSNAEVVTVEVQIEDCPSEKTDVTYKTRKKLSVNDESSEVVTSYPSTLAIPTAIKYQHAQWH